MTKSIRGARAESPWRWGLGGMGALGVGLAACTIACSLVLPALAVLGAGAAVLSAVDGLLGWGGRLLIVGGLGGVCVAAVLWWRHRRRCPCRGPSADSGPHRPEPINCSLDAQGVRQRLDEFRQAFERAYIAGERLEHGVRWRFRAEPNLDEALRDLAKRENACCRFFRFEIRSAGDEVWWDTQVENPDAQPVLEEFFQLPGQLSHRGPASPDAPVFWPRS